MSKFAGLLAIAGVAVGFVLGFLVANSVNRSEINGLRAQLDSQRTSTSASSEKDGLSEEEIRDKIAEADQNPKNVTYQKNLGLALYRYGAIKNDSTVIAEAIRLLERASQLTPNDKDIALGLANAQFDFGYSTKDNASLAKARESYRKILSTKEDVDIRTDLGMTYFLHDPPDDHSAITEFKRVLAADPQNQKALEFVVQSLTRIGNGADAAKYLEALKQAHPTDASIANLQAQLDQVQK